MNVGLVGLADTIVRAGLSFLIQSTILIAVALATARWLARTAAVRSAIYRATLLAVVALPVVSVMFLSAGFSVGVVPLPEGRAVLTGPALVPAAPGQAEPRGAHRAFSKEVLAGKFWLPDEAVESTWPTDLAGCLYTGLAAAWAGGTALLLVLLARANHVLAQIRLHADLVPDGVLLAELRAIAARAGVRPPELLQSRELISPVLTGIVHPAILLPQSALGEPSESLRAVLVHEVAHLRRRDCLALVLARGACAVFFFQPLLWLLVRRMEEASDEVTDDLVLAAGVPRTGYARDLTNWAARFLPAPRESAVGVGVIRFRSALAGRIQRILDAARPLQAALPRMALLATAFAVAAACATAATVGVRFPQVHVTVATLDGSARAYTLSDQGQGTQWLRISDDARQRWLLWPYRGGRRLAFREAGGCIVVDQDGAHTIAGIVVRGPNDGVGELYRLLNSAACGFMVWCAGDAVSHLPVLPGDRGITLVCDVSGLRNLGPLARQRGITRLLLYGCDALATIEPLGGLTGLEYLALIPWARERNLAPLRRLPRLRVLGTERDVARPDARAGGRRG